MHYPQLCCDLILMTCRARNSFEFIARCVNWVNFLWLPGDITGICMYLHYDYVGTYGLKVNECFCFVRVKNSYLWFVCLP